jgi:choice-of-anchor A domain-containing protein
MKSLNAAPFRVTFSALSLMLLGTGSAMASTNALGLDPSLNLLVFENFAPMSSDVEGTVAVGGNANISGYSINAHNLAGTALTVGGNLSFSSGSISGDTSVGGNLVSNYSGTYGGNVAVGGNLDATAGISGGSSNTVTVWGTTNGYQSWYQPQLLSGSGSFSQGVDFNALRTSLTGLSTRLDGLAAASAVDSWGTWVFTASNANGINVFDITSAQADDNMRIDGLGANGSVIINVLGSTVNFGNHGFTNFNNRVLFNLPQATTLQLGWVDASILAPFASVGSGYGLVEGQVVVNSWASSVQINDRPFVGQVPLAPIPEPETYAMLLAGLGLMGAVVKRRKAKLA